MNELKLLIIDDHKVAREALVSRLSSEPGIQVKGIPASAPEVLNEAMQEMPDIALLDIKTCIGDGLKLCKDLVNREPRVKVVVLTSCASPKEIEAMKNSGIAGYLFKDLDVTSLLEKIIKLNEK